MKTNLSDALWRRRPRCVQPVVATDVIYSPRGGVPMAQLGRPGLSAHQKQELWSRWRMGQSISEIGRALGKQSGSIHGVLASNGGVTPYVKSRACCALTLAEREEISRGLVEGLSVREIAALLQRAPSTVSREIARNRGRSKYRAALADDRAWIAAKRPQTCLLAKNKNLRKLVAEKLQEDWPHDTSEERHVRAVVRMLEFILGHFH